MKERKQDVPKNVSLCKMEIKCRGISIHLQYLIFSEVHFNNDGCIFDICGLNNILIFSYITILSLASRAFLNIKLWEKTFKMFWDDPLYFQHFMQSFAFTTNQ